MKSCADPAVSFAALLRPQKAVLTASAERNLLNIEQRGAVGTWQL